MKISTKYPKHAGAMLKLALPALTFFGFAAVAPAQSAGYDLFQTGSGAYVDLSSMNLGTVNLQGMPIQGSTGNTDTMMYRSAPTNNVFPVNVYALYMKSTSPVTYKGQSADVYITINNSGGSIPQSVLPQPDSLSASTGSVTTYPSTSTFDSNVTVNADVILVTAGGSPTNSSQVLGSQAGPSISLTSTGSPYSTSPPSGYPNNSSYPSGGFYPQPKHKGPHPVVPSSCNTGLQPSGMKAEAAVKACITSPQTSPY